MSGGSFNYLYGQDPYDPAQLTAMAQWFREHEMFDAAVETESFLRRADKPLENLWMTVEWFASSDWSFEEVAKALDVYRMARER